MGVWFQPCSLPLAESLISLSEPNPSPFTYSAAGAVGGGGAQAEPATSGPEHPQEHTLPATTSAFVCPTSESSSTCCPLTSGSAVLPSPKLAPLHKI